LPHSQGKYFALIGKSSYSYFTPYTAFPSTPKESVVSIIY